MARQNDPVPTEIQLHQKSRLLEIAFEDGARFRLPCEYLREFSPAAEVRAAANRGEVVTGKEDVNISQITPVGSYAIQLHVDDGHDTGIYAWSTLYTFGQQQEKNWAEYRAHVRQAASHSESGSTQVRLLYFVGLVDVAKREAEDGVLPVAVDDVAGCCNGLRDGAPSGSAPSASRASRPR
jgi:DUF971 family protein